MTEQVERPDLSQIDPTVRAYVEFLEAEVERLRGLAERAEGESAQPEAEEALALLEPTEPPTTLNLVTIAASGLAKRTLRHLYSRQRRGGMGVFDLDTPDDDPPAALAVADERGHLLVITNRARAFRLPAYFLNESPVRARPQPFVESLSLEPGEHGAIALPIRTQGYLAVVSEQGYVRTWPAHLFAETMRTGLSVLKPDEVGAPAAAGWAPSDGDLFIATRQGLAVRFTIKSVPIDAGRAGHPPRKWRRGRSGCGGARRQRRIPPRRGRARHHPVDVRLQREQGPRRGRQDRHEDRPADRRGDDQRRR